MGATRAHLNQTGVGIEWSPKPPEEVDPSCLREHMEDIGQALQEKEAKAQRWVSS